MANLWKDPEFVKKADAAKKKAWTNFLNHFPKAGSFHKKASTRKTTQPQRCFSKKAKARFKVSSVQTGGIGARK